MRIPLETQSSVIPAKAGIQQIIAAIILSLFAIGLHAAIDPDEFSNDVERQRYQQFIADLRCPKCQNQNLAGSDAPIANDLRRELRRLLKEGQSDQQIVDFMVGRYGDFVLYRPPFNAKTAVLWLAPLVLLALGAAVIGRLLWRHRRARTVDATPLSADEQAEISKLLGEKTSPTPHTSTLKSKPKPAARRGKPA